jgi:tRNA threonylcarbamoyladenosine biosynthesis protein TsaB
MSLLAIDSATRNSGLAIYDGVQVLYECSWNSGNYHSVDLAPGIQQALQKANIKINELKAIAVAIGPGSYTGLRIGLAMAKGLALAHKLALIAVPTLDIVAAGQAVQELPLVAVLQAGRGRLAVGWYTAKKGAWLPKGELTLMNIEELTDSIKKPTLIAGELDENERRVLGRKHKNALIASAAWSQRRPAVLAELAWERWQAGKADDPAGLAPLYLQASDAVPL